MPDNNRRNKRKHKLTTIKIPEKQQSNPEKEQSFRVFQFQLPWRPVHKITNLKQDIPNSVQHISTKQQ